MNLLAVAVFLALCLTGEASQWSLKNAKAEVRFFTSILCFSYLNVFKINFDLNSDQNWLHLTGFQTYLQLMKVKEYVALEWAKWIEAHEDHGVPL